MFKKPKYSIPNTNLTNLTNSSPGCFYFHLWSLFARKAWLKMDSSGKTVITFDLSSLFIGNPAQYRKNRLRIFTGIN